MDLSPEEADIVRLVGCGLTDEHIARTLGLGRSTVQRTLQQVAHRLGVCGRTAVVVEAIRQGAVDIEDIEVRRRPHGNSGGIADPAREHNREPL